MMETKPAVLVVGGDSLVGGGTARAMTLQGHDVYTTTRRRDTVQGNRVYLDFESDAPFRAPSNVSYAFLIAAATSYERCERDPQARVINEQLIPQMVATLLEQGLHVTFISTNSVFGGERPWPHEDDAHTPLIPYARQKSSGEAEIRASAERLGALSRLNIVRLTKILNAGVSPLPAWLAAWKRHQPIEPFADLVFAPISLAFVADALARIGERRVSGNLHISGAANISYVDLANALARKLGVDANLIRPTTAVAKGVNIAFKPKYSGLGMKRTKQLCGIDPQSLDQLVDDLIADIKT